MASPTDAFTISVRCSGNGDAGLIAKTKIEVLKLTAANFNAQSTAANALATAEAPLTSGILASTDFSVNLSQNASLPTGIANRGQKWIISAANANGRKFTYTIPAGVFTGNVQADNFTADLTSTAWAAFVTAFNAVAVDPAGNSLTLIGARTGGRRR